MEGELKRRRRRMASVRRGLLSACTGRRHGLQVRAEGCGLDQLGDAVAHPEAVDKPEKGADRKARGKRKEKMRTIE